MGPSHGDQQSPVRQRAAGAIGWTMHRRMSGEQVKGQGRTYSDLSCCSLAREAGIGPLRFWNSRELRGEGRVG